MDYQYTRAIRSEVPEIMDDLRVGGRELTEALTQLAWINRLLGAPWITLEGVYRIWRSAGRPRQLTLLDVGAGGGESNRLLLRWARWAGIDLRITLIDIHPETCDYAARLYQQEPRVRVEQGDLYHLAPGRADLVTASLVLHHIPTADLPRALGALQRAARLGVVINDLHRHPLAEGLIRLATRLLSRNQMIRHDAPLSVRRGFRAPELLALRAHPGLEPLHLAWRPFFRYLLTLPGTGQPCER